jgi:hypothetical protein
VSWDQEFFDPIELAGRKSLVTLRDAAEYITKLPKAEHEADEWQAAMEALLLVAEHDWPTMFARLGIMRALHRNRPWINRSLSVSYARLCERTAALDSLAALQRYSPDLTIEQIVGSIPFTRDFLDRVAEGLNDLGLSG